MNQSDRLRAARIDAGFPTAEAAAARHGWTFSTYRAHENGNRGFKLASAIKYGQAYKVSPEWLFLGTQANPAPSIPVTGCVGTGAEVLTRPDDCAGTVKPGGDVQLGEGAVVVRGASMWPKYDDGDILIYAEATTPKDADGHECLCEMKDGSRLLRTVRFKHGRITLEAHNVPPLDTDDLAWCAPIRWIKRHA